MKAYVTILDGDLDLLPFFVRHYKRLGATEFPVLVYDTPERQQAVHQQALEIILAEGAETFELGSLDEREFTAAERERFIRSKHSHGEWAFFCDLDEFAELDPDWIPWYKKSQPFVEGRWIDRCAEGGRLVNVIKHQPLEKQFPCVSTCGLRKQTVYVLSPAAPYMHHPGSCRWGQTRIRDRHIIRVHHFKWQGNVKRRLKRRAERIRGSGKGTSPWMQRVRSSLKSLKVHDGLDPQRICPAPLVLQV